LALSIGANTGIVQPRGCRQYLRNRRRIAGLARFGRLYSHTVNRLPSQYHWQYIKYSLQV